eukprot:TRINITY_DN4622_c0_g1_i1.p1 TRINITY_DN4622_c0_g1~~TRINITY_DN4622_c0_g1_i1.p1  ORF type:complete len:294 (+),score=29.06 TRINITY_DN4622_c0_g1_i1:242-1123(+)
MYVCFFVMALLAVPMWQWLATRYDKRNIWLAYNLVNSLTNFMYVFVGRNNYVATIIITLFNGIPVGGQFLIESVLADVIDYDEFLHYSRTEGAFTVFATFIPKLVSIPAQALPLAIISAIGFQGPTHDPLSCADNRMYHEQTDSVKTSIRIIFVGIPCVCTIVSFIVKLRYPIKKQEIVDDIAHGVQEHMRGNGARDPLTEKWVVIDPFTERQEDFNFLLDNFSRDRVKRLMLEQGQIGRMENTPAPAGQKTMLVKGVERNVIVGVVSVVGFTTMMGTTFKFLLIRSLPGSPR